MKHVQLPEVTKTVRSKNAGIDQITFDIVFSEREIYEYVKEHQLLTEERVLSKFNFSKESIDVFVYFDPAQAVKFTIDRRHPNGSPGEHDLYGAQQYPPLFDITLSLPDRIVESNA